MIPLLVYKYTSIETNLDSGLASTILDKTTGSQSPWFSFSRSNRFFQGSVSKSGFIIHRTIQGRNSFLPMLFGRFVHTDRGTKIVVHMTFHPLVWAFLVLTGYFVYIRLAQIGADLSTWLPFGIIFGAFGLVAVISFVIEAIKAEKKLKTIYQKYLV